MAAVDSTFAQWLQDEGLWALVEDAPAIVRWAAGAVTAERMTAIALREDAEAEAARQLTFLGDGFPLAIDEHVLIGEWRGYLGQVITLTGPQLDYDAGVDVFVIGVADDLATGLSTVTVVRRLVT